jgi:hypothetical protein
MRLSVTGCLVSACLVLVLTSTATADPLYATELRSDLDAGRMDGGFDSGRIANSDDAGPLSDTVSDSGNTASSTAFVLDGSLHAFVSATSSTGPFDGAFGNVSAFFYDTFTLTSATLPEGTLVPFKVSIDPFYTIGFTGSPTKAGAIFQVQLDGGFPDPSGFGTIGDLTDLFYAEATEYYLDLGFVPSATTSDVLTVPIGTPFRISMFLFAGATGQGGGSGRVDALGTATLHVETLDAYTYSTASGNSYQSPAQVPEPASLTLLGFGIVGALAARKRRG